VCCGESVRMRIIKSRVSGREQQRLLTRHGCFVKFHPSDVRLTLPLPSPFCLGWAARALDNVNHPDNLYLTCKSCNSSLGDAFPDKTFRDNIVAPEFGTIGDWLRKNEEEIRKS